MDGDQTLTAIRHNEDVGRITCVPGLRGLRCGAFLRLRLDPDSQRTALRMIDLEDVRLSDKIAELPESVGARIEIGGEVGEMRAHRSE